MVVNALMYNFIQWLRTGTDMLNERAWVHLRLSFSAELFVKRRLNICENQQSSDTTVCLLVGTTLKAYTKCDW